MECQVLNHDFPRIITFLRKEKGLSQKQAAADLGVSQALLSHYEKGIRECGLDFLIRTAEYYDVSTDYLLGRTVQRKPSAMTDIPDADEIGHMKGNMINQVNKKLITNTNAVVFDLLAQLGDKRLTNAVSNYLMCAEYEVFRVIYCADKSTTQTRFSLDRRRFKNLGAAAMLLDMELIETVLEKNKLSLALSPDIISGYFDKGASSLFNLIQFAERNIRGFAGRND